MPTPYRGYTEIPGGVVPDVPYRVNLALREVDADIDKAYAILDTLDAESLAAALAKASDDAAKAGAAALAAQAAAEGATGPVGGAVAAELAPGKTARNLVDAAIKTETAKVIPLNVSLYGTFAARPAHGSVAVGATYYASDTQESYRATAAGWVTVGAGGTNLATAGSTVGFTTQTANVFMDVPGLTATFMAGTRPVEIKAEFDAAVAVGGNPFFVELVLGTRIVQEITDTHPVADKWKSYSKGVTIPAADLTPGQVYTVKARIKAWGGIARVDGGPTKPAQLTVSGR